MITIARNPMKSLTALSLVIAITFVSYPNSNCVAQTYDSEEKSMMDTVMEQAETEATKNMDDDIAESNYDSCHNATDGGANTNLTGEAQNCPSGGATAFNNYPGQQQFVADNAAPPFVRSLVSHQQVAINEISCKITNANNVVNTGHFTANFNQPRTTANYYQPVAFMGNVPKTANVYSDLTRVAFSPTSVIGPVTSAFTSILSGGGMGDIMKKFCESNPGGKGICSGMQGTAQTGAQGLQNMASSWKRPKSGPGSVGKPQKSAKTNQGKIPKARTPQERNDCQRNGSRMFGCTGS